MEPEIINDMKKIRLSFLFVLVCFLVQAQKFKSDNSSIHFYSKAPIEDIEATNTESTSIIDLQSNAFVFVVPISKFSFEKKLMQEHFNENYLESDKYPKAIFKGKISNWSGEEGEQTATATGQMLIHGVENEISIEGTINRVGDEMNISAVFPIALEDYKIKIPKALFYNIAEKVEVTISFKYKPYESN